MKQYKKPTFEKVSTLQSSRPLCLSIGEPDLSGGNEGGERVDAATKREGIWDEEELPSQSSPF